MDKQLVINFLLKETIKDASDNKPEEFEDKDLWNSIWKAHRDTLTGARFHCPQYLEKNAENAIVKKLYWLITDDKIDNNSRNLLTKLEEEFTVEYGALQKLVNMTLKYLIVFNSVGGQRKRYEIDESQCDCPIDSQILEKLNVSDIPWTTMTKDEYNKVQELVKSTLNGEQGNIYYDFLKW